jgi:hypothetical protein
VLIKEGADQVVPLSIVTVPSAPTATQNVADTHDIDTDEVQPMHSLFGSITLGFDQLVPLKYITSPKSATA